MHSLTPACMHAFVYRQFRITDCCIEIISVKNIINICTNEHRQLEALGFNVVNMRLQGMQIVVLALIRSIPPIASVAMFGLFEFVIFAIIGVQLFAGRLGACNQAVRLRLHPVTRPTG